MMSGEDSNCAGESSTGFGENSNDAGESFTGMKENDIKKI
jgi:hypothetical protein